MIVYRLDERMDEVQGRTGRGPAFKDIAEATKVSVSVLSNMGVKPGYTTTTRQIDALFRCSRTGRHNDRCGG